MDSIEVARIKAEALRDAAQKVDEMALHALHGEHAKAERYVAKRLRVWADVMLSEAEVSR